MGAPASRTPSSLQRLNALRPASWSPRDFAAGAAVLREEAALRLVIARSPETLPEMSRDTWFRYPSYTELRERWHEGEELVASAVLEGDRLIAYGIAVTSSDETQIEIIDVDTYSRRSAGLQRVLTIGGIPFGVGVAHIVADALVGQLHAPIAVDATSDESRFVFRALGFTRRPKTANPCLYEYR